MGNKLPTIGSSMATFSKGWKDAQAGMPAPHVFSPAIGTWLRIPMRNIPHLGTPDRSPALRFPDFG